MANKKSTERNIRKISKLGGKSFGITIPVEIIKDLGWREKQLVKVTRIRGGITIKDLKKQT